jgi:chromate transporter
VSVSETRASPSALFAAFLRLGATAFGGPAIVPYIGALATRRGWASRDEFAEGVALCQSIPGATAMQTAAYVGLRAGGVRGAAAAYAGFGLPAVALMIAASAAHARVGAMTGVQAAFGGLRAIIVALVASAAFGFARAHVRSLPDALVALGCALAFSLRASSVLVIAAAVLLELVLPHGGSRPGAGPVRAFGPGLSRTAAGILAAGIAGGLVLLAAAPHLGALAFVFMKVDALAFGGGFAAIPLMLREAVEARGWLDARTFMDGIALGQVTPGPIVVTATFVGYQAGGLAGAVVASVAVFFPSFVLVTGLAPWFSLLRHRAWFPAALHGALLSFVGLLVSAVFQLGHAVAWDLGRGAMAVVAFLALRGGVDVLWVVLAGGAVAALAW